MKKIIIISLGILVVSSIVGFFYIYSLLRKVMDKADNYHVTPSSIIIPKTNIGILQSIPVSTISVATPSMGDTITSPLIVSGKAWGSWFFEGVFPVRLVDGNGLEISRNQAHAQEEWTVADFVSFEATLKFQTPTTETGTLILEKDNPSGLPQNAEVVEISITF